MVCSISKCGKKYYAKGFCGAHYQRNRLGKKLDRPLTVVGDDVSRLLSHVELLDDCWIWRASQRGKGYGGIKKGDIMISAHRFAYELFIGNIPNNLQIDHLCMNKLCVNPAHLEPVTNKENQFRAYKNRGHWPIQGRSKKIAACSVCGTSVKVIMYERVKYCSNACRCRAYRQRKLRALS